MMKPVFRSLRRQPGFTVIAILTLALGIGVNVAIFSAIEALVINPLPYHDANRLVAVYEDASWIGYPKNTPAPANFADWKQQSQLFEDMAATSSCRAVFTGDAAPEEVRCRAVGANLWPMLGVRPVLGRWFTDGEDHPDPNVALIGEGLWTRRFGRDPNVLNRNVLINGTGFRIVGIMPGWFHFGGNREMEMWTPNGFTPQRLALRGSHFLTVFGKLKAGVTAAQASAELAAIQRRINAAHPSVTDPRMTASAEPLSEALLGKMRGALWILMGAAGMVLLIACANVANLLLARATGRQHEMAVRTSLGASNADLLWQVFSETLVLTGLGGLTGIGLALLSRKLLENFVPIALQGTVAIGLDFRVLAFAALASVLAAAIASFTPILHVLRSPLMALLRQDSRTGSARSTVRLRGILVASEVALTVALLAGAGLMIRSLIAIWQTDLGFNPDRLMTTQISLPAGKYGDDEKRYQFYDQTLVRLRAVPGIEAADYVTTPPFYSIGNSTGFAVEGVTPAGQYEKSDMLIRVATESYLETIGAKLVAGRFLNSGDRNGAQNVAVINESFARAYYRGQSAIGRRISLTQGPNDSQRWRVIVGVVKEINERGFDYAPKPVTYITVRQSVDWYANQLIVRARQGSPAVLLNAMRAAIQTVDPNQPLGITRTFEEVLALDQASRRQQMFLLIAFSSLSLIMASLGIYAVLVYSVELRRREIGLRLALGADRGNVVRLVMAHGMRLTGIGAVVGIGAAVIAGRLLRSSLYEVAPFDPVTLGAVCCVLAMVALAACWIPSRRAAGTPPSIALRG